jgi:hypothetical protein
MDIPTFDLYDLSEPTPPPPPPPAIPGVYPIPWTRFKDELLQLYTPALRSPQARNGIMR